MVSAMRIAALLGISALAQAEYYYANTTATTTSTTSTDPPPPLTTDNCLLQLCLTAEVASFCATFTADVITTGYLGLLKQCSGDYASISSACSSVVSSEFLCNPSSTTSSIPSSTTCQPSTITVMVTPPFQIQTTTQTYVNYYA